MPSALTGEVWEAAEVSAALAQRLFDLHARSYEGADRARFDADLAEKQWVILLREAESGQVVGFSTQRVLEVEVDGQPVRALFSGDTIIDPEYWGEQALVRAWCRLAGQLKAAGTDRPLYWFLISKGHRTYLYLPTFFRAFYPRYDRPTPAFEEALLRSLGRQKYPEEFDARTGLVIPRGPHDRLKGDLDGTPRRLQNPHVAFFRERNPGYREGHELVCVAEIDPANMRGLAGRELRRQLPPLAANA